MFVQVTSKYRLARSLYVQIKQLLYLYVLNLILQATENQLHLRYHKESYIFVTCHINVLKECISNLIGLYQ